MAITERYCNPDLATGLNDGTSEANAWQSLSTAASSYAAGHRVNIKRTSSRDASGNLTFATSATDLAPVHIRGYTSTIGDGGMYQTSGRLIFSGNSLLIEGIDAEASLSSSVVLNLSGNGSLGYRCRARNTYASTNNTALSASDSSFMFCDAIVDSSDSLSRAFDLNRSSAYGCRGKVNGGIGFDVYCAYRANSVRNCYAFGNGTAGSRGMYITDLNNSAGAFISDNYIFGVGDGIGFDATRTIAGSAPDSVIRNAIYSVTNGIYNNQTGVIEASVHLTQNAIGSAATARYSGFGDLPLPGDITLTADPFVDAANGDFTLNNVSGGGALLRAVGFQINMAYDWGNMTDVGTFSPSTETSHTFAC